MLLMLLMQERGEGRHLAAQQRTSSARLQRGRRSDCHIEPHHSRHTGPHCSTHALCIRLAVARIGSTNMHYLRKKHTHTHTHTHPFNGPLSGGTTQVSWYQILLKQEIVSGSGISWNIGLCKSAPCFRQITTPAPHHSVFTGRMPFLPPNQQHRSTEGNIY